MNVTTYPVRVDTRLDAVDVPLVDVPPIDESIDVPAAAGLRS